jgi:hypothetical protein
MACDTPFRVIKKGECKNGKLYNSDVLVPCGKCPSCKKRRVNEWTFRLEEEDKVSSSSHFITLTYDTECIPITPNGYKTLLRQDFQKFMKRLRKRQKAKIKYYACGEYGEKSDRPHYHAIIFNVTDPETIAEAWTQGSIHYGDVSGASIAYTAKYIDKQKNIPEHDNDDRVKEFSLMSLKLGQSFITPEIKKWYKEDITRNYVTKLDGIKIALPKYYRNQLFTDLEKELQVHHIQRTMNKLKQEARKKHYKKSTEDFDIKLSKNKIIRHKKFYRKSRNAKI